MGPFKVRYAALLLRAFVILQIFQIATATFTILPRDRKIDSRHALHADTSVNDTVLILRADNPEKADATDSDEPDKQNPDWARKNMVLDEVSSCEDKDAYLVSVMDTLKEVVRTYTRAAAAYLIGRSVFKMTANHQSALG